MDEEQIEFEKTVVTEQGETIAQLREIFDSVCSKIHWKDLTIAKVEAEKVGITCRALEFFHGVEAKVLGPAPSGLVYVYSDGYKG